jgi:integrase
MQALAGYRQLREQLQPTAHSPALLISTRGTRLLHSNIGLTFTALTRQVQITARSPSCRPRIHDLRHSFAVATVLDWYRDGVDVTAMMPRLSTYLGHIDPKDTYWYLESAPELMALAGQRLDTHLVAHAQGHR